MSKLSTDILILGGGVIGLSIARELHKLGARNITVLERGTCGREATWAAAGMLSPQAETDDVGPFFDLCSRSRDLYPEFAGELLDETGIDMGLDRTGTLCVALTPDDAEELAARREWQDKAGLTVEQLSGDEIREFEPELSSTIEFGLRFPNDWQVDNRKIAAALHRYAELNGIRVLENTPAQALPVENGAVVGAETDAGTISAVKTIVATGAWTSLIKIVDTPLPVIVEPVRGQMVCLKSERRPLRHVVYTSKGYLVPRQDGRVLAGSTTEHVGFDKTTDENVLNRLADVATDLLPNANLRLTDSWAGLRPFAPDALPVIGHIGGLDGLMIATGHYRNGILLAPLTAKLVAESVVNGRQDDVFSTFGPQRFSKAAGL